MPKFKFAPPPLRVRVSNDQQYMLEQFAKAGYHPDEVCRFLWEAGVAALCEPDGFEKAMITIAAKYPKFERFKTVIRMAWEEGLKVRNPNG